jgi:hypothetical protein
MMLAILLALLMEKAGSTVDEDLENVGTVKFINAPVFMLKFK